MSPSFVPARRRLDDLWLPDEHNLKAWNYDPLQALNSDTRLELNSTRLVRVPVKETMTVSTFAMFVFRAGATLTANQNFMGLFSRSGDVFTRERLSGDLTNVWNATGMKYISMGTAITINPPDIWVAFLANGTTAPGPLMFEFPSGLQEAGLDGGGAALYKRRTFHAGSGHTSIPTSFNISVTSTHFHLPWCALR